MQSQLWHKVKDLQVCGKKSSSRLDPAAPWIDTSALSSPGKARRPGRTAGAKKPSECRAQERHGVLV